LDRQCGVSVQSGCAGQHNDPPNTTTTRSFASSSGGGRYSKKKPGKIPRLRNLPEGAPRIFARPPGEKPPTAEETAATLHLPDRAKENELSQLQHQVQTFHKSGQYQRALSSAETLLKATMDHFGENHHHHPATAAAYNNCGLMRKLLGDFDAARKDYEQARKIYKATVGTDHASYASALHNLGNLNRSQIHFDTTLKATDRLTLVELALEYLEEAYRIRYAELGADHPHTVASRSSRGATLAAQILHHHKLTVTAKENEHNPLKQHFYISLLPKDITASAWSAAIDHLRGALHTALQTPRGARIGTSNVPKGYQQKGKKERPTAPASPTTPQTLSAAAAAQNLAVVLKSRATTVSPVEPSWLQEAEQLYQQALSVQTQLLEPDHPDLFVTKHSLAELWHVMGKEEEADALRREIVDTYDPPPAKAEEAEATATAASSSS
jgi:tetratricopeptide (TPR) repeat protein